jgi:hypothetical protein
MFVKENKTMKEALWNWLVDFVRDWLVPKEDYLYVQDARNRAENHIDRLQREYVELMDSFYDRSFKTYEQYGESVNAEYIEHERVDLREFEYSYHFRIPYTRFVTLTDLTKVHKDMKTQTIARLTKAFEQHMRKNLFRDL